MPQAGWAAFFKALWANAFVRFVVQVAVAYVLARVTAPKPPAQRFRGTQTTARGSLEYRKFGYGQAMIGGTIIYQNTRGIDAEWLDFHVAYTDHLIEELVSFRLDNRTVQAAVIDWVPPTADATAGTGTGEVDVAPFKGGSTFGLKISWYPGFGNQPANTLLTNEYALLGASDQARGVFNAVFQCLYVEETQKMWRHGAPQSLLAVAKMQLVYDPRLDTTNGGTGPHRYDDELTWEWSDNPALCIANYLIKYMEVDPTDEVDWPACIAAADDCDVLVAIPTAQTQKRFTCNGVFIANEDHEEILDLLKNCMAGTVVYTGGTWVMQASVYTAPTLTFDANALAGDVQIQGSFSRDERINIVRGFFADPTRQWRPVEFQTVEDAAYIARDGGRELEADMDMAFVNNDFQCQRIARRALDQFDNQTIATFVMNEQGAKCYPGLWVNWDLPEFGWSNKIFRCIEWRPNEDGSFEVTFQEDYPTRYDDPLEGGYAVRGSGGTVTPAALVVPAPTNLVATGGEGSIVLTWDNPPATLFEYVEIWSATVDNRASATKKAELKGSTWTDFTGDTLDRFYWVRSGRSSEDLSAWLPIPAVGGVQGNASSAGLVEWYYIKATNGTAIHNGVGTLTLETRHVLSGVDSLANSGNNQLYVGTTLVTVANGYATGSDGYTGVLDAGDITDDVVVELKDGPSGTVIDSITLVDIADGADGGAGSDGLSVHVSNIYRRSASAPTTPTGGSYNFGTGALTVPTNWSATPPAGTEALYVSTGQWSVQGTTGTDNTTTWSAPAVLIQDAPTADGVIKNGSFESGNLDFWTKAVTGSVASTDGARTGTYYYEVASAAGGPELIGDLYACPPVGQLIHVSGYGRRKAGDLPDADAIIAIRWYDAAGVAVSPTISAVGSSLDFTVAGWQQVSDSVVVPALAVQFAINLGSSEGTTGDWQFDDVIVSFPGTDGVDGADGGTGPAGGDGDDGLSVHVSNIYRRASSAPATPTGGSYNFTTSTLTPPSLWSESIPAGTDTLYVSVGSWSVVGPTGTDSTTTWTAPQPFANDAPYGYVEFSNGSAWTRAINEGPWTPAGLTTDMDCNIIKGGTVVGRIARRITITSSNGELAATVTTHQAGDLNTGRFTVTVTGSATTSISVKFSYTYSGQTVAVTETVSSAQGGSDGYSGQIMHSRDWVVPVADNMGDWHRYNGSLSNMSILVDEPGPFSEYPEVLQVLADGVSNPGWYGGLRWDHDYIASKSYIYYVWVKRVGVTAGDNGLYMGYTGSSTVADMAGTPIANAYFISNRGTEMILDKWYLAVGVIYADGFGGADQGIAGIYNPTDGQKVYDGIEFQWNGQLTGHGMRMAFYDNVAPVVAATEGFQYTRPTGWVRDGSEPSISAVLGAGAITGNFRDTLFQRNAAQPATPTGNNPSGWFDGIPAGSQPVWQTTALKDAGGNLIGVWSTPEIISAFAYRGAWVTATAYILNDVVTFAERSYVCVLSHTSATTTVEPSGSNSGNTWWDLLAGKGDPGDAPTTYTQTIGITGTVGVNLRTLADNHTTPYNGIDDTVITWTLGAGVTLVGSPNGGDCIDTGSWPGAATHDLTLEIAGTVRGGGGRGGDGGNGLGGGKDGSSGGNGGDAISCLEDIDIEVQSGGLVEAAGGGGGGGGGSSHDTMGEPIDYGGGGGGGGDPNGSGGAGGTGIGGIAGGAGTISSGGTGGGGGGTAGAGGNGGNHNVNGSVGIAGTGNVANGAGGGAGVKGYAIRKNGKTVNVTGTGTVTGTQG